MRILHVIMTFHKDSAAGGPVYNVYAYAQALQLRGHQISVCCSDYLDLSKKVELNSWRCGISAPIYWDGIQINYTRSFHFGYGGYGAIVSPVLAPYLHKVVENYDVIHIHGTWNTFGMIAGMLGRLHRVPYIIQLHNTFPIRSHRIVLKRVFHWLLRTRLLNHAAAILAFTEDEKKEYLYSRPQDEAKTHVVPGVIPTVEIPKKGQFRHKWDISSDDCLVLFLGRLHRDKGIDHLIQSLQFFELDGLRLVIVGPDAGYADILREMVNDLGLQNYVLFTGPIYGKEKFAAFGDADMFVLPSLFEQLPVSALEASLCEVPLILSDRCGMTKMVTETNAGMIVPYGSPQALAKAIRDLSKNSDLRNQMGKSAKIMVEKCCDNERTINTLEAVYLGIST